MPSWIIAVVIIAAAVIADVIYLVRRKKSGKCSCGHECGSCSACKCCKEKRT